MKRKQYRTIDSFLSDVKLAGWKTPKPQRQLSWEEIKGLYQRAVMVYRQDEKKGTLNAESEYYRIEEEISVACLSWTEHGEKPLAVRIHDWLEDNVGSKLLQKPLALRQELWYRAIGWEFHQWRFYVSRQYFDGEQKALDEAGEILDKDIDKAIDKELKAKEKGIEAAKLKALSERIDDMMKERERISKRFFHVDKREEAWNDDYYKQKALLRRWLQWRGFRLSDKDIDFRLSCYVYLGCLEAF